MMAEATMPNSEIPASPTGGRTKFLIGGLVLLAAVAYLIITSIASGQQYFTTINEMVARQDELTGRQIRVSGAVIGDTIEYDGETLSFEIAHLPYSAESLEEEGGLAEALHTAVNSPNANRVKVVMFDEPKPDLLQHEAQAIVTGTLGEDGVFYADELFLKCPTRYEEAVPEQAEG
jgi:cytochrome c-type biogenesis protein CcmE